MALTLWCQKMMSEKLKGCKEALRESLSLYFIKYNGVWAAYTKEEDSVDLLLSKESLKETILVPIEKLIVYHYMLMHSHGCNGVRFSMRKLQ